MAKEVLISEVKGWSRKRIWTWVKAGRIKARRAVGSELWLVSVNDDNTPIFNVIEEAKDGSAK